MHRFQRSGPTIVIAVSVGRSCQTPLPSLPGPADAEVLLYGSHDEGYRVPVEWIGAPASYGPGDYGREMEFEGRSRFYKLHVPPRYDRGRATPVVLVFHGGGGTTAW